MTAQTATALTLSSPSLHEGERIGQAQIYNGFGYKGQNLSPELAWSHIPPGTQSFALGVHDPDAPHPGGWWHWLVIDIPAAATRLPQGVKPGHGLPAGARQIENDFGMADYGGPAPPPGKAHRYVFTIYALKTAHLGCDAKTPPARVLAAIEAATLAKASITGLFGR